MLDARAPVLRTSEFVRLLPQRWIFSIAPFRGRSEEVARALGVELPGAPKRVTAGDVTYLWNGPGAWLAMSEAAGLAELVQGVVQLAAVTEQSDGLALFRVTGPQVRAALAKLVPIDLHPSVFAPDAVALTLAAHMGAKIWQEDDGAFVLACFRSFAGALHHALLEATAEFETEHN